MSESSIEAVLSFGWYLVTSGTYDRGESVLLHGLAIARSHEDTLAELASLQLLGQLALRMNRPTEAARYFSEVLTISLRTKQQFGIASAIHNHGELALTRGDLALARTYFIIADKLYRKVGHATGASRARHHLLELADMRPFG